MLIVGLTGSIGMGKSTAAKHFRARQIPVFDADAAVHALYQGGEAVAQIEAEFPGTTNNGKVDRKLLSAALRGSQEKIHKLESIVHPLVRREREAFLAEHVRARAEMAVLEIPLLFETGSQKDCDATIVVSAPAGVQRERVLARDGMTAEKLEALLANQMPDEQKRELADYVVDTSGPVEQSFAQIDTIIESLRSRTPSNT